MVKGGDKVNCTIADLKPLRAEPEDIPLDIVYEDEHVLVVNKSAHMVRSRIIFLLPLFQFFLSGFELTRSCQKKKRDIPLKWTNKENKTNTLKWKKLSFWAQTN